MAPNLKMVVTVPIKLMHGVNGRLPLPVCRAAFHPHRNFAAEDAILSLSLSAKTIAKLFLAFFHSEVAPKTDETVQNTC